MKGSMRTLTLAVTCLTATTTLAAADADLSLALDTATLEQARTELVARATKDGIDASVVELMLANTAVATSSDTGCPGIDVDVINAAPRTLWNIEVKIEQQQGSEKRTDVMRLPYLRARTKTRTSVSCLRDHRSYGDPSDGISLGYVADASRSLEEALPLMIDATSNVDAVGMSFSPSTAHGTLLEAALATSDEAVAGELVQGIVKAGRGGAELAAAAIKSSTIAGAIATSWSKVPPAQQIGLVRALLASPEAERWERQLLAGIDRACAGRRDDATALWVQAQPDDGIRVPGYRDRIRARCKVTARDARAVIATLEQTPAWSGPALDAVDDPTFAAVLAALRAHTQPSMVVIAYVRDGARAARFATAAAAIAPVDHVAALPQILTSAEPTLAEPRAAWVAAAIAADLPQRVEELTSLLVEGKIVTPQLRAVVRARCDKDPKAEQDAAVSYARQHSPLFDPEALASAGVDLIDFLALTARLGDCETTLALNRACLRELAGYKPTRGVAIPGIARGAMRPRFLKMFGARIGMVTDAAELDAITAELTAVGLGTDLVVEKLCRDVEVEVGRGDDPAAGLARVAKLAPNAPCIAAVHDRAIVLHRKKIQMLVLGLLALIVPVPLGGLALRRRFRKLQRELPVAEAADLHGKTRDDRLGRPGLGRALGDGVRAAIGELAATAARPALAAIDDAVLDAATATVQRAVASGDAATLLVRRPDAAIYVVALPIREPRPQTVPRYLGAPWPDHLAAIQRAVGGPVLALIVLCDPGAAEATLLVGYDDATATVDPDALLDAKQARARNAHGFRYVMALTAPATAAAQAA